MGGKSSSSNDQQQETLQLTSDGVIAGDLFQGKSIRVTNDFPEEVSQAFTGLIGLVGDSLNLVGQAGEAVVTTGENAITQISDRANFAQAPELQTADRYIPVILAGIAVVGLYSFMKLRK